MKKTRRKWLSEMDEPERSEALKIGESGDNANVMDIKKLCIYDALMGAFIFQDTPQGEDYWYKIANKYRNR